MASIKIVGNAAVLTSRVKFEDLKKVEKHRPEALTLTTADGEPVFRIATSSDVGDINKFGATFNAASHDGGLAEITLLYSCDDGDPRELLADEFGSALVNIAKIEDNLPGIISEIEQERTRVLESINFA